MYRALSMYPRAADPAQVDEVVERIAAVFKQSPGFQSFTTSVDALMGPGAKRGEYGRVVVADFDTLEHALGALNSEALQETRAAADELGPVHYLFEYREI